MKNIYVENEKYMKIWTIDKFIDPSLSWLLKVTPAVYPHLNDFTGNLNFRH